MHTKSLKAPSIGLAALTIGVLLLSGCTQPSPTPICERDRQWNNDHIGITYRERSGNSCCAEGLC